MAPPNHIVLPPIKPWQVVIGSTLGLALYRHHWVAPAVNEPAKAWVNLILLVVAVSVSLLAGYLIAKQNKATLKDDKPTTLVTRGSFITWVLGVRRVGPLFTWAGDRRFTEESSGKKGGGSAPKQKVWHEAGWHVLAIGPGFCLHHILNNGQAIFQGPITRVTHPSGTFIDLGSEGGFFIFWGEPTQPPNTFLGNANRVGVTSRWPYHFYVVWADKNLGPSANWPLLDYEIEVRVESTNLVQSDPHLFPTRTLTGPTVSIFDIDLAGGGTDRFILQGAHSSKFPAKSLVRLTGNACPDQDLEVLFSELFLFQTGTHPISGQPIFENRTRVHFADGDLTSCDDAGSIQAYTQENDFGINAAHAIDTILHATWPHGIGLPTPAQDPVFGAFDLVSLENVGVELSDAVGKESLRTSWIAKAGDTVSTVLGTGLQDLGIMIPIDPVTGLVKFVLVREPSGILPRIRDDLIVDELPETEVLHAERPGDRITFSFPDRTIVDRDATIAVMDDGQISYFETQHARNIQLTITTDFKTASSIVQRRSQEELAGASAVIVKTNRATRTLLPGDAITVDALPEIMRVSSIKLEVDSNKVVMKLMADFYGVAKSPFIDTAPPITGGILPVEPDLQKAFIEVPEYLTLADPQTIIITRIRAHAQIFQATHHISRDNITYFPQGDEFDLMAGGTLVDGLPAPNIGGAAGDPGGLMLENTGPLFTSLGPDIGTVIDLSADLTNWRLGRQIAVISSLAGIEICFCRNVTFVSGDDWTADGLIRARWDTLPLDHPAGAEIYIFEQNDPLIIQDPLLVPEVALFVKTQPQSGGILPLAADAPFSSILYGKAKAGRPVPAAMLTVTAPDLVNVYETGDDVSFHWGFGTPQSPAAGAGLQGAGVAIVSLPSPDEDFVLEVRDITGITIKRTEILTTNIFTYTNANIVADHGGEPSFQVWVYQRRGGLVSDPTKLTVERI